MNICFSTIIIKYKCTGICIGCIPCRDIRPTIPRERAAPEWSQESLERLLRLNKAQRLENYKSYKLLYYMF